jgi:hypothetical protein
MVALLRDVCRDLDVRGIELDRGHHIEARSGNVAPVLLVETIAVELQVRLLILLEFLDDRLVAENIRISHGVRGTNPDYEDDCRHSGKCREVTAHNVLLQKVGGCFETGIGSYLGR